MSGGGVVDTRLVEELGADDDGNVRIGSRRSYAYPASDDDDDETSEDDGGEQEQYGEGGGDGGLLVAVRDPDEALVQAALQRIRRAQEKGKKEVKLSKAELAAYDKYERRRKALLEAEEARRAADTKKGERKKKAREQRFAVPIPGLEPALPAPSAAAPRRKRTSDDSLPRHPTPASLAVEDPSRPGPPGQPALGWFPTASSTSSLTSRARTSRQPSGDSHSRGASPLSYDGERRVSDNSLYPGARPLRPVEHEEPWVPRLSSASSRGSGRISTADPSQYQTSGPRAPYPPDDPTTGETTEEESEGAGEEEEEAGGRSSDEARTQQRQEPARRSARSRPDEIEVVEDRHHSRRRRSPVRRKPVGGSSSTTASSSRKKR